MLLLCHNFETPPGQQNTSVANIAMQEGVCRVENIAGIGEEERVLGKPCGACGQERRAAVAVEPQPESYSASKLQHITLGVRGASQKSQTNVAAVFSLRQWDPGKISPLGSADSPVYSLGSLIYPPTAHTHTHIQCPPPSQSVSQETSR